MTDACLHSLGALEAADLQASGSLTSAALVEHLLSRIAALEPVLHALVAVHPQARDQARESDARRAAGVPRSALEGIPVIIKDNIEAHGLPGTAGSLAMAGSPAQRDAVVVQRLRRAGLVVLASANLSEWANFRGRNSASGWSGVVGQTQNPWRVGHSPGGSSSGCGAALAAGYAPLAVGTETDGSITCPAALCGVVGVKPTLGSVPTAGIAPIAASQDVVGPMARSVADAAALLEVLTDGAFTAPAAPAGPRRFVLGAPATWRTGDPATDAAFDAIVATLRAAGFAVVDLHLPADDERVSDDEVAVLVHEMSEDLDAYLAGRPGTGPSSIADVVAFNAAHADRELAHFGQEHLEAAVASEGRADPGYAPARTRNLAWAVDRVLAPAFAHGVDALIAPAYGPAWPNRPDGGDEFLGGAVTTAPAIAGWPILTLPFAVVDGLPVGVSLVGPAGGEQTLVDAGAAVEAAVAWAGRPPLPNGA